MALSWLAVILPDFLLLQPDFSLFPLALGLGVCVLYYVGDRVCANYWAWSIINLSILLRINTVSFGGVAESVKSRRCQFGK